MRSHWIYTLLCIAGLFTSNAALAGDAKPPAAAPAAAPTKAAPAPAAKGKAATADDWKMICTYRSGGNDLAAQQRRDKCLERNKSKVNQPMNAKMEEHLKLGKDGKFKQIKTGNKGGKAKNQKRNKSGKAKKK